MPRRQIPIVTNELYHVFNRGVGAIPIFKNVFGYKRMIDLIDFYRFKKPPLRFSHYNRLTQNSKKSYIESLHEQGSKLVEIYAFCLMPNHFHFLLRQLEEKGVAKFMKNLQNAYAKYFNTKYTRGGSLFQLMFKANRIETDEQLIHVQRYIHLNPLTSYVLKEAGELNLYKWSSFTSYSGSYPYLFVNTDFILKMFGGKKNRLIKFMLDQVDYQRKLDQIKHLMFE